MIQIILVMNKYRHPGPCCGKYLHETITWKHRNNQRSKHSHPTQNTKNHPPLPLPRTSHATTPPINSSYKSTKTPSHIHTTVTINHHLHISHHQHGQADNPTSPPRHPSLCNTRLRQKTTRE